MPLPSRGNPFLDAMQVMRRAAAEAINICADDVAIKAIDEAPLEKGTLRASAVYPANDVDGSHTATQDKLEAMVSFNTVYAAAQHEGMATQHRNYKVIPLGDGKFFTDKNQPDPHIVEWVVKRYTTPGTKSHYLSDPLKSMAARYEHVIGLNIDRALAVRFG